MNISINARHMGVSDDTKGFIEDKLSKLPKLYDAIMSAEVIMDHQADKVTVEIVVTAKHKHTFVAKETDGDMHAAVDMCLDKLQQQIRRHKDKVKDRQKPPMEQIAREQ